MEKETYNIDDILSEVKKRREEAEFELKSKNKSTEPTAQPVAESELTLSEEDDNQEEEAAPAQAPVAEPQIIIEETPEEAEKADNEPEVIEENEQAQDSKLESEPQKEAGMVDLFALASGEQEVLKTEEEPEQVSTKKAKKKSGVIAKRIIITLIALIIIAVVFAVVYANGLLNKITDKPEADPYEMVTYYDGMDFLQEDFPAIEEMSASELYGYKEYLKQWYKNGDPVSSTHILNVLLIGEDTRDESISDTSRADSAIIASINVDTNEIHLTSILRDLYVYFEIDGNEHYGKINESASLGGMSCYIKTIERYYKIAINNYAVVNFASFPKIIDALDGVNIKITSNEINEINNHPKRYGGVTITQTFDGTEGTMKLNGKQALAYCRIRKIDSDGARANRQKTVLTALLKKMKSSGTIDTVKVVNQLAGYVYTGYDKKELISIGNTAIKDGWLNYEIKTENVPRTENCKGGQNFSVAPNNWIWLADIPKDAYELQMNIYGKSNIKLNENRPDYIALGR